MRRRQTRVPNAAQGQLGFVDQQGTAERDRPRAAARFVADEPWHLYVGPERVDEYLTRRGKRWIVHLRRELEQLDYTSLLVNYEAMGRRPYHPRTLLGLIVYGMLKQKWSLRELEELAALDVGAWWICGGHQPDHSTIGDFIERHKAVLSAEFFTALVSDLVRRRGVAVGMVAGDGTVIESVASRYGLLSKEAAEQAAERAQREARERPDDEGVAARAAQAQTTAALAAQRHDKRERKARVAGGKVVASHDPEAVVQPRKDGARRPSYRPSVLVHEAGLVVGQHVHPSSETAAVPVLVAQHHAAFGALPDRVLLDANYHSIEVLRELAERDVDVLCPAGKTDSPQWERKGRRGLFAKSAFRYDAERNAYCCPAGHWLEGRGRGTDREGRGYRKYRTRACVGCALRARCTRSRSGRALLRFDGEEYKEAMAAVLHQPRARALYRRRAALAERPFAELRWRQGLVRFRRRGVSGTAVEFALHCIAFDLKWAIGSAGGLCIIGAQRRHDGQLCPVLILVAYA